MNLSDEFLAIVDTTKETVSKTRSDLSIDGFSLEEECAGQPVLYDIIATEYSHIYCFVQRIKVRLEEIRAEIGQKIRRDPDAFGLSKITESSLNELITIDKDVVETKRVLNDAIELSMEVKGLLDAYEHRRSMLSNEVQLRLSGLGSKMSDVKTDNYEKKVEEKRRNIKKKRRRIAESD